MKVNKDELLQFLEEEIKVLLEQKMSAAGSIDTLQADRWKSLQDKFDKLGKGSPKKTNDMMKAGKWAQDAAQGKIAGAGGTYPDLVRQILSGSRSIFDNYPYIYDFLDKIERVARMAKIDNHHPLEQAAVQYYEYQDGCSRIKSTEEKPQPCKGERARILTTAEVGKIKKAFTDAGGVLPGTAAMPSPGVTPTAKPPAAKKSTAKLPGPKTRIPNVGTAPISPKVRVTKKRKPAAGKKKKKPSVRTSAFKKAVKRFSSMKPAGKKTQSGLRYSRKRSQGNRYFIDNRTAASQKAALRRDALVILKVMPKRSDAKSPKEIKARSRAYWIKKLTK